MTPIDLKRDHHERKQADRRTPRPEATAPTATPSRTMLRLSLAYQGVCTKGMDTAEFEIPLLQTHLENLTSRLLCLVICDHCVGFTVTDRLLVEIQHTIPAGPQGGTPVVQPHGPHAFRTKESYPVDSLEDTTIVIWSCSPKSRIHVKVLP